MGQVEEKCSQFFPIRDSVVILAMYEGLQMERGSDEHIKNETKCPDKDVVMRHMMMLSKSLSMLCDCFLARAHDEDEDPLWKRFYRIQMSSYLIAKRNLEVSPPEGDMVHDLIRDSWAEVKDYMENSKFGPISNVDQWFKTIRIDFHLYVFDPSCTFFSPDLFLMCQKDTKNRGLG